MKRFCLFVALAGVSFGATINATTCSVANVNSAITTAASGDTVSVPSGTCAWDTGGGVSIPSTKGINLVGGRGGTTTITGNAGLVIASNASVQTTVSNFTFTGIGTTNNGDVSVGGSATSAPYRIHHNIFTNSGQVVFIVVSGNGTGLIDHNTMTFGGGSESIHNVALGPSDTSGWSNDVTPGSSNMVFVEDNTFNNTDTTFIASGIQSYYGARTVVRHNTFIFTQIDQHGTSGNIGARWWELYQNTFESMGLNQCCYMAIRAGSGVIWGNVTSGPEPAFGDATIELVEEDSGYPALYQIGRGISQALSPAYVWGNGATLDVVSGSGNVQINRDYYLSGSQPSSLLRQELSTDNSMTTYSYVPYPYPNPLQGITVCASGCTYTTFNAAEAAATCPSTITVLAGGGDGTGSNGAPLGFYRGGAGLFNNPSNRGNALLLTHGCTPGNEITVTTDQVSKLPTAGTRVTPAYINGAGPVLPVFYNTAPGLLLYAQTGNGGTPASGYIFRGIAFCCSAGFSDYVAVGSQGLGTQDTTLNVTSDIPNNFTFDHVMILTDPGGQTRKCFTWDAPNTIIKNSWIDCTFDPNGSDFEAVNGGMGTGSILNSYISGITETISVGGAMPPVFAPAGLKSANNSILTAGLETITSVQTPTLEIGWTEVTKPNWAYQVTWSSTLGLVPKGQLIRSTSNPNGNPLMQAQNAGVACTTQPTWPASAGLSVTDCGGVIWLRTDSPASIKNGIECKTADSMNIHHNFIHQIWNNGGQGYVFTVTSSPSFTTQAHCNNILIQNNYMNQVGTQFNSSGMDTANELNIIPGLLTNAGPWTITSGTNDRLGFTFNINGTTTTTTVTLTAGSGRTSTQIVSDLNAAFGSGPGNACETALGEVLIRGSAIGSGCFSLGTVYLPPNNTIQSNAITRDAATTFGINSIQGSPLYGCTNPRGRVYYSCGQVSGVIYSNNITNNMNTPKYYTQVNYTFAVGQHINNVQWSHNTSNITWGIVNPNGPVGGLNIGFLTDGAVGDFFPPFSYQARDNVFAAQNGSTEPGLGYCRNGNLYDFSCINWYMGQPILVNTPTGTPTSTLAAAGTFSHNVIPLAVLWTATTRNTNPMPSMNLGYNSYPSDNYSVTTVSLGLDPATLKVTTPPGPGTDYKTPGADPTTVPRILGAKITTSDRAAILNYTITEPMANSGYGCVAYVTTKDSYFYNAQKVYDNTNYAPVLADMDPSQYTRPDWDGNDSYPQNGYNRTIVIGLNSPLSASSTNYLRLLCPGAAWPEDGTSATVTTVGTLSGSVTLAIQRSPSAAFGTVASISVVYGTTYSRASGTISGGGTQSGTCSGSPLNCAATITGITKGQPLYVQVKYLSAGAAVLYSDSVVASIPQ